MAALALGLSAAEPSFAAEPAEESVDDAEITTPAAAPAPADSVPAAAAEAPVSTPTTTSPTQAVTPPVAASQLAPVATPPEPALGGPTTPATVAPKTAAPKAAAPPAAAPPATPSVEIAGYLQGEYQIHQDSEDQLRQGGALLNQNRFLVRRARLVFKRSWQYSSLQAELDGNTTSGPAISLYRAEASLFYRRPRPDNAPPLVELTVGMFRLPFGRELPESSSSRWFMERTQASRALFPTEIDLGARLSGAIDVFRYAVAVTNGEPLGEKAGFPLQDPNRNKDITFSVGAKVAPLPEFEISGGVSANTGRGFHSGTGVTKSSVNWRDANENGLVDAGELVGAAAQAETPSKSFDRFAVGADLELSLKTALGTSQLFGELVAAKNLDRGFFVADPVVSQVDLRELGWQIGVLQSLSPYGMLGFRAEFYDPNADGSELRAGKVLPLNNKVRIYSPMLGLALPGRARLSAQYDIIRDHQARDSRGVPTDLRNNAWTFRLQVNL